MSDNTIRYGDTVLEFEDAKRGGLRWAVGSPNSRRSSAWRMWGNKKGDVYLSVRSLGGILKTSFHKDGNCFTGFTSSYANSAKPNMGGLASRHWDKWKLPDEPVVRAVQIVVPGSELRQFETDDANQMKWLPAPAPDSVSVVTVFIAKPHTLQAWPAAEHGAQPLGLIRTSSRVAWAVFFENRLDERAKAEIEHYRLRLSDMPGASEAPKKPGIRSILWGWRDDRDRFFIELAWDEELAG